MSERSTRRRSKTARALAAEEQAEAEKIDRTPKAAPPPPRKSLTKSKTPTTKAKTDSNGRSADRSLTPSSKSSSRAASPASSTTASTKSSSRRRSTTQRVAAVAAAKRTSGANTPISRASRSSSVASNSGRKVVPKLKLKTKLGRGYNPNLVNYKDSEYHYGSDFEDDDHPYEDAADSDKSSDCSDVESHESDDLKVESDVDLDEIVPTHSLPQTPMPYWLREDEDIPPLEVPKSSEDLLVPDQYILKVFSVYEILRRFHQILRLSPFRVEDFCAAIASEEQSNLLSEVHMALLKTIFRAEEANGATFGPIDQKDSINCLFFFMDSVTWPECLRAFLQSDPQYAEPLEIARSCEYPFAPVEIMIEKRVEILSFLADQILSTSVVRDFITEDGQKSNEEHCRVCHRLGEMLVCDSCPGVFHLGCLDPPLEDVPEEEWRCYVCQANEVEGVTNCAQDNSNACRQDCLGIDRMGNKYWFICRRLVVEKIDATVAYYSTVRQLEELSEVMDEELYEKDLWEAMEEIRIEMERQMDITEAITNAKKAGSKKSYFEIDNANIEKLQKEREELKQQEESNAGNKIQEDLVQMAKKVEPNDPLDDEEEQAEIKRRKEREERLKKREVSRGDGFPDLDDMMDVDKEEEIETTEEAVTATAMPTTTTTPMTSVLKIKKVASDGDVTTATNEHPLSSSETVEALGVLGDLRVTRKTLQEISSGTLFFKLGQEGAYKSYINQYTAKTAALSKLQANEERLKKQHMSHKFSLTDIATFKWVGSLHGSRSLLVNTLRQTMLQLESSISPLFMHPNWGLLRKPWIGAASVSIAPRDFARALTVLQCCMKPSMMLSVWHESLGHTMLKKITNQMKEDRKKLEKRERREKEEEDERLRPFMAHVKYTLGLKHQVSKQKGEEYRAHGQFGWLWLSASRNFSPSDCNKLGLRAGPHRVAVKYSDIRDGTHKVVLMEPKAFDYLHSKQDEIDQMKKASEEKLSAEFETENAEKSDDKEVKNEADLKEQNDNKSQDCSKLPLVENKRLEEALKNARLERQVVPEDLLREVIDVCAGLSNPTRVLYSKVAKKSKVLDDFLSRRLQLKNLEERRIELKAGKPIETIKVARSTEEGDVDVEDESESKTSITSSLAAEANSSAATAKDKSGISIKEEEISTKKMETEKEDILTKKVETEAEEISTKKIETETEDILTKKVETETEDILTKKVETETEDILIQKMETETEDILTKKVETETEEISTKKMETEKEEEISTKQIETEKNITSTIKTETAKEGEPNPNIKVENEKEDETNSIVKIESGKEGEITLIKKNETGKQGEINSTKKIETVQKDGIPTRVYSSVDTSGKLYLKRIQSVAESKKQSKVVKYPLAPHFYAKTRKKRNILLLAKHDVKHLARKAGQSLAEGFNYNAKINTLVWPYPCPRATFKTTWLFKTACLESLQAVGLQLRILWASIRWDDMAMRPISIDGKHQQTTDTAISTTEILKHRHVGRYLDKTQYFQRKVTIPLDVPKTVIEVTPIRSGLRKRKRAESPQQSEPRVVEEWVDEEKLELWEIRAYRERLEREKNASITRSRTGTSVREPQRLDPSSEMKRRLENFSNSADSSDIKTKMDEQIRLQREAFQNKTPITVNRTTGTPTIIRRVTNPDGSVSLMRTTTRPIAPNSPATPVNLVNGTTTTLHPSTKKVFISKDGKIIGAQILPQSPGKVAISANPMVQNSSLLSRNSPVVAAGNSASPQQKVQIVRSSDGKIQVRGLLPGQQLVQMPDGKLQIFTNNAAVNSLATPALNASPTLVNSSPKLLIQTPSSATYSAPCPQLSTTVSPQKVTGQQLASASAPKQIFAQLLAPGSPIPHGMTAFISGGKTYCIPKAATTLARQQQATKAPATMLSPSNAILPTTPQPQQQTATAGKQMVEVKSLGSNTVTFKGHQMIVSGPDVKEAQNIAKLLSTGQARLASLGGKQVLISSTTAVTGTTQKSPQTITTPILPTHPVPVNQAMSSSGSLMTSNVQLPLTTDIAGIKVEDEKPPMVPVQVTAQLLQTAQGPRIVLQGIQGSNLPKEDLGIIQQQVKHQLLKAQAEAKQQGKVPPTKILIDLPPSIQAKLQPQSLQSTVKAEIKEEGFSDSSLQSQSLASPKQIVMPPTSTGPSQPPKMIVVSQPGQKILGVASPSATQQQASILLSNLTPTKMATASDKFEVTPSYIQKAITDALKSQNLSPEIEQKLRALQQHNIVKSEQDSKLIPGDEDWEPPHGMRSRKTKSESSPHAKPIADVLASLIPLPPNVVGKSPQTPSSIVLPTTPLPQVPSSQTVSSPPANKTRNRSSKSISCDEKRKQQIQSKLQATLFKQKEQLKKDIAKKRALQEKELQIQIHRDLEKIRQLQKVGSVTASASIQAEEVCDDANSEATFAPRIKKKRPDSDRFDPPPTSFAPSKPSACSGANHSPPKKKKRHSSSVNSSSAVASGLIKKDKVYCICKTKYDPSKFYVGCDICNDWFHGSCVGITEGMSRNMTNYICDECQHAIDNQEIYCLCKQPYDESQFYIGCERCSDWFHGRCVGILQSEAETIDEYICPNCEANSRIKGSNT